MWGALVFLLAPALVRCAGDGNIRLLEEDVATAMQACAMPSVPKDGNQRTRRSEDYRRIDSNDNDTGQNMYAHERRNTSYLRDQMYVLNATDNDYGGYGVGNGGEKYVSTVPRPASGRGYYVNSSESVNRTRRNEPLLNRPDSDQCLSQCIFANLQVVDSRGIPREAELWNKVQSSVTSQQSRVALRDQIRACFQELQSEAEDNGCSYSNKLERCLMLRFSDRLKPDASKTQTDQNSAK